MIPSSHCPPSVQTASLPSSSTMRSQRYILLRTNRLQNELPCTWFPETCFSANGIWRVSSAVDNSLALPQHCLRLRKTVTTTITKWAVCSSSCKGNKRNCYLCFWDGFWHSAYRWMDTFTMIISPGAVWLLQSVDIITLTPSLTLRQAVNNSCPTSNQNARLYSGRSCLLP